MSYSCILFSVARTLSHRAERTYAENLSPSNFAAATARFLRSGGNLTCVAFSRSSFLSGSSTPNYFDRINPALKG